MRNLGVDGSNPSLTTNKDVIKLEKKRKETVFDGYMSGDYECFCLSKVPFQEWLKKQKELYNVKRNDEKAFTAWYNEFKDLTLYPSRFFPKECEKGRWQFKIIVEAEKLDSETK